LRTTFLAVAIAANLLTVAAATTAIAQQRRDAPASRPVWYLLDMQKRGCTPLSEYLPEVTRLSELTAIAREATGDKWTLAEVGNSGIYELTDGRTSLYYAPSRGACLDAIEAIVSRAGRRG
jgi:hypothetical protein